MPRNAAASRRYASALFDLVQGDGPSKVTEVLSELRALHEITKNDELVSKFLSSPILPMQEKLDAVKELEKTLPNTHRFVAVLVDAGRFDLFPEVLQDFEKMCEESTGELTVTLETARPLPEKVINNIKRLLEERWQKRIKVKPEVNPEIIGGFLAKAPGRIMDGSVRSQLESLEQQVAS